MATATLDRRQRLAYWRKQAWHLFSRNLDGFLIAVVTTLSTVGLLILYSAADQSLARTSGQFISFGVALGAMWVAANVPPRQMMLVAVPLYVVGLALLVGVAVAGDVVNGARRWLNVGITRIQPSEIMKIAVPLLLAAYFEKRGENRRLVDFLVAAVLICVPFWLIKRQPDLGTALLVAAGGFYVIFFAGLSWRIMIGMLVAAVAAAPLIWPLLHGYQQDRILTLIDPTRDPLGKGFHTIQATIALGSGGSFGKGWREGTQTHLDFLPEKHTDFIFAVFGEEFGLFGAIVLLTLYTLLIARGLMIAANASTLFARLLGGSISLMFFTYAFVNIGMVSGILPVVGVPLPLISYGGTALVTLFLCIGILMSIQAHRKLVKS